MICERCDHELATSADWYHADGCAHCRGLCWRSTTSEYGVCSHPEIDWRGRALAAEADRDNLAAASENNMARALELAAARSAMGIERDAYRAMVCDLLASAHPRHAEHPSMAKQWDRARDLLKNGVIP